MKSKLVLLFAYFISNQCAIAQGCDCNCSDLFVSYEYPTNLVSNPDSLTPPLRWYKNRTNQPNQGPQQKWIQFNTGGTLIYGCDGCNYDGSLAHWNLTKENDTCIALYIDKIKYYIRVRNCVDFGQTMASPKSVLQFSTTIDFGTGYYDCYFSPAN